MSKTIYIFRHGQTDLNKNHIVQGSGVDSSLNKKGREQAELFYEKYHSIDFEVILTSKLQRTHQTVSPFFQKNIPWEQFPEINEICWGIHEGKSSEPWMIKQYKQLTSNWSAGKFHEKIENGESAFEMGERLQKFIGILKARPENKILVCSHGRAMRALICLMNGLPLNHMQDFKHHNTGLYLAHYHRDKFEFELNNDISHLEI